MYLGLLLTLSRKTYVNKLLFRDFSAAGESQWYSLPMPDGSEARVHEQSVTYLQQVLARKPSWHGVCSTSPATCIFCSARCAVSVRRKKAGRPPR